MTIYYNEFDKRKCAALLAMMEDGFIGQGDIDDRPIQEVKADELKGYTRCHFFAGYAGWELALQLAGWPADKPVWTGSAPCQPFSTAGKQKGKADERHLWPVWFRLIRESRPPIVYGEQVPAAIRHGWWDDVADDLEGEGYATRAEVRPAVSVGAPHRRDRLWFVAHAQSQRGRGAERTGGETLGRSTTGNGLQSGGTSNGSVVAYNTGAGLQDGRGAQMVQSGAQQEFERCGNDSPLGNAAGDGRGQGDQNRGRGAERVCSEQGAVSGDNSNSTLGNMHGERRDREPVSERQGREKVPQVNWASEGVWIACADGKQRLVKSGICLLVNGYSERVGLLHAAGDGIVPALAARFIEETQGR